MSHHEYLAPLAATAAVNLLAFGALVLWSHLAAGHKHPGEQQLLTPSQMG
jgi:hypothetical protein